VRPEVVIKQTNGHRLYEDAPFLPHEMKPGILNRYNTSALENLRMEGINIAAKLSGKQVKYVVKFVQYRCSKLSMQKFATLS
jgi:hypothetical protein